MKKKIITGVALSVDYIILCRLMRGYWALDGDLIVIAMAAAAYLLLGKGVKDDAEKGTAFTVGSLFKDKKKDTCLPEQCKYLSK